MAHGLASVADDGDDHSEVKLLRASATLLNAQQDEIERLSEIYRREREAHAANLKEQQKCEVEIERLRAELADAHEIIRTDVATQQALKMRRALMDLRIELHALGRRPEECHMMSVIDDALADALPAHETVVPHE